MAAYYSAHGHGVMNMNSFKSPSIICSFSFIPLFWHNAFMYQTADQNYQMRVFFFPKILILDTGSMSRFALWWLKINIGLFSSALQFSKLYCNSVHSVYYRQESPQSNCKAVALYCSLLFSSQSKSLSDGIPTKTV